MDRSKDNDKDAHIVRLITLSGTSYEGEIKAFANRMNRVLATSKIKIELVKTTGPSIARSLFKNNNNGPDYLEDCGTCIICRNDARNASNVLESTVTGKSYRITRDLTCANGGIYVYDGGCKDQYTGKTTVPYSNRTLEHLRKQKNSSVYKHMQGNAGTVTILTSKYLSLKTIGNVGSLLSQRERISLELSNERGH